MRSTFKVLFYVNGSKEKNGIVPIMGRVTIKGSLAQSSVWIYSIPLKHIVTTAHYNGKIARNLFA